MPFKHSNIQYRLPHEEYPQARILDCIETLENVLELKSEPVGITFLFSGEEYNRYPVEETKASMPYCVMVKRASQRKGLKNLRNPY